MRQVLGYMSCKSGKPIHEVAQEGKIYIFFKHDKQLNNIEFTLFHKTGIQYISAEKSMKVSKLKQWLKFNFSIFLHFYRF